MASAFLRQSLRFSTVFAGGGSARSLRNLRFNRTNPTHTERTVVETEAAKERSDARKEEPDTNAKLQMYARHKQEEAQKQYIHLINGLGGTEAPVNTEEAVGEDASEFKDIKVTKEDNVFTILLNRPAKQNAISWLMFDEIIQALDQASKDDSVTVAVITGAGEYYSSGFDLEIFMNTHPKNIQEKLAGEGRVLLQRYVAAFIDFPKPLIAAVNGKLACLAANTLCFCDAVYASDMARFRWPLTEMGNSLVGCSSYNFPKIMGNAKATEVLLFNKKLTAHEACERGLVTEVFPHDNFQKEVQARVNYIAQLPPKSVMESKKLIRDQEREKLHKVNVKEAGVMEARLKSERFAHAITSFAANRAK